jgi:DnaK suppressor protein
MNRSPAASPAVVEELPALFLVWARTELERQRDTRASSVNEHEVGAPERSVLEHDLVEIDAALARLAAGAYGRCTSCGTTVPVERLEIMPAAELCVRCQHEQETRAF